MPAHCSQEDRWDHERDSRKHDPRPGDRDFPHRLATTVPTAVEVAALVKQLPDVMDGAALIEAYADSKAAAERMDAVRAGAGR